MISLARWACSTRDLLKDRHLPSVEAHRMTVILSRLPAVAALWVVLTLSLVLLDFIVLPFRAAIAVALGRMLTSIVFIRIAFSSHRWASLHRAYWASLCLYSVPALQCLFSYGALRASELELIAGALLHLYWILPVLAMATLVMLPLTVREIVFFATPALIAAAMAVVFDFEALNLSGQFTIWLRAAVVMVLAALGCGFMDRVLSRTATRDTAATIRRRPQ